MKRRKPWHNRSRMLVMAFLAVGLAAIGLWVESRTKLWYRLFWPDVQDIGLAFAFDSPDYGQFTLTNVEDKTAQDVVVVVREDFSYVDEGVTSRTIGIGDLKPGAKHICSYRYHSPNERYDIGRLDVWIRCERGKAFECIRWSYAGW